MSDYKLTLIKIQTAFYSDTICPAIFPNVSRPMKHSRYPGPRQNVFCSLLFPEEIMNNPDPELNTHSIWPHPGSLSLVMNGNFTDPVTGLFRNGFKRFRERTLRLFCDPANMVLLIEKCEAFLESGGYDYENFCYFFNTEISQNPAYFKPKHTFLYRITTENPPLALAFFLIFALIDTDAVSIVERYLETTGFSAAPDAAKSASAEQFSAEGTSVERIFTEQIFTEQISSEQDPLESISVEMVSAESNPSVSANHFAGGKYTKKPAGLSAGIEKPVDSFENSFILPSSVSNFCGRKRYLEVIHELLHMRGEAHHLFLHGMSGIGKTELAKKYASAYQSSYDVILFLDYQGSLLRLICNDVVLGHCRRVYINGKPESDESYFTRKIKVLWGIAHERVLLIIDNFNVAEDPSLKDLLKGNYCVLFTTQTDFSENGYRTLPVIPFEDFNGQNLSSQKQSSVTGALAASAHFSMDELLEPGMTVNFFQQNYGRELPKEDIPYVQQLMSMFNGHLFVLELIARQMRVSRLTAEEMLDFLKNNGIYATRNLEKIRHYSSNTPLAVYEYVQHMVSSEQLSSEEQYILKNLALLPVSGVPDRNLKTWCELTNYEVIEQLISKSLIRCDRETGLLFLHPLIRELILINLHPSASDAECMIRHLALTIRNSWSTPKQKLAPYDTIIYSLLSNLDTYTENTLQYYEHLLEFSWQQGHFDLVIEKAQKAYNYCRRYQLDHSICGSICRAAGNCCYSRGIQSWADSTRWFCLMWHHYHTVKQGLNKEAAFAAQKIARSYLNQAIFCDSNIKNRAFFIEKALKNASGWCNEALNILHYLIQNERNSPDYSEYQSYCGDAHYMNACICMTSHKMAKAFSEVQSAISCYLFPDGRIRSTSITAAKTLKAKLLTLQKNFSEAARELEESTQMELQFRGRNNNSHLIRIYIAFGDLYCRTGQISLAVTRYQQAAELIQQLYEPGDGRYFQEVSSKLLLCEHARENKTLQVPITTGI